MIIQAAIGTVKGSRVGENRKGAPSVRLLEVQITDPEDIRTVELYNRNGEDYNPPLESKVLVIWPTPNWALAVGFDDNIESEAAEGEKWIYATVAKAMVSWIKCLNDGTIEINGNDDNAVRYAQLKNEFDLHIHSGGTGPGGNTGVPTVLMTPAVMVDSVKLPGAGP